MLQSSTVTSGIKSATLSLLLELASEPNYNEEASSLSSAKNVFNTVYDYFLRLGTARLAPVTGVG